MHGPSTSFDESLERLRNLWRETATGQEPQEIPIPNEIEFYCSSMLFSIQLRLANIEIQARRISDECVRSAIQVEKTHIQQELQLCSEIVRLLFQSQ